MVPAKQPSPRNSSLPNRAHSRVRVHGTFASGFLVKLAACRCKFCGLLLESTFNGNVLSKSLLGGVPADIFSDAHAAEVWSTHAAKMCGFRSFLRQCLVVELTGGLGV